MTVGFDTFKRPISRSLSFSLVKNIRDDEGSSNRGRMAGKNAFSFKDKHVRKSAINKRDIPQNTRFTENLLCTGKVLRFSL